MIEKLIDRALETACKRLHDGRDYLVGAVGIRTDGTLVHARNEKAIGKIPSGHAEARLTRKLGANSPMVVVARYSKGRQGPAMAKPCEHCLSILRSHRVQKVVYTTDDGSYQVMSLVYN